ncbi:hypothetical protein RhiirA1_420431, partial [Rhizophagus irregularis]
MKNLKPTQTISDLTTRLTSKKSLLKFGMISIIHYGTNIIPIPTLPEFRKLISIRNLNEFNKPLHMLLKKQIFRSSKINIAIAINILISRVLENNSRFINKQIRLINKIFLPKSPNTPTQPILVEENTSHKIYIRISIGHK